jgi:gamma-butyrobetaine dioxygenase
MLQVGPWAGTRALLQQPWSPAALAALPPLPPGCPAAAAHARLRQWGLVQLQPEAAPGGVLAAAARLGTVTETNYGRLFDVRAEAQPTNLAFTPSPLGLHTDNPYREPVPGFQALHCLQQASAGGETLFCDGWGVAAELAARHPGDLALLLACPLTFRYAEAGAQLSARRCVLAGSGARQVSYNARSQVALALGSGRSAAAVRALYAALARFEGLCREERHVARLLLAPGAAVVWNNERLLHGRAPFEGPRHLQGCYLSRDSVLSAAAVALDRQP